MKNPRDYTIKELRAICQGPVKKRDQSFFGRFTRIFSIYLTAFFLRTPITPNQITVLGSTVFLLGTLFYFGEYRLALWGPVFYLLSIIIDGADGEVARFREIKNKFGGAYAEPVSHDVQYGLFFFIVGITAWWNGFPVSVLIAGALASISKILFRIIRLRYWDAAYSGTDRGTEKVQEHIFEKKGGITLLYHYLDRNLFGYPGIFVPLAIATISYRLDLFLYFYALVFTSLFILLLLKHTRMISKL